jgi:hypothetical protein
LKFKGEKFAEVWFKPEDDPLALMFRIPQGSFHIPGIDQRLTPENLLKSVAIAAEDVESWCQGDVWHSGLDGTNPQLRDSLPQPPEHATHLDICVRLKPPTQARVRNERSEPDIVSAKWQDLEVRWKALLGLEATMDTLRISMEGVRAEMEGALKRSLTTEEKMHALAADVTQWNKAKSRVHYALPKTKEFIHRAVWAKGAPERKRLDEIFKSSSETHLSLPEIDKVAEELEILRKDRQILSAQGTAVYQECKSISADVQACLRTLQSNSAARAVKKKGAARAKRK